MQNLTSNNIKFVLALSIVAIIGLMICGLFFIEMPRENANLINTALGFAAGWVSHVYSSYFNTKEVKQSEDDSNDKSNKS